MNFPLFENPDQVQAYCAILGIIIGALGTWYVAISFKVQKNINQLQEKINIQQLKLNEVAANKHIRDIRPIFSAAIDDDTPDLIVITLTSALAKNIEILNVNTGVKIHFTAASVGFKHLVPCTIEQIEKLAITRAVKITFEDEEQRGYRQWVSCGNNSLSVTFPNLLKDNPFNTFLPVTEE